MNSTTPEQPEPEEGARLRDEGIERADDAANPKWIADCDLAIYALAVRQPDMTADDVWIRLGNVSSNTTKEGRAMGARMKEAAKRGWINITPNYRPSVRKKRHCAPMRVWRSQVYQQQP